MNVEQITERGELEYGIDKKMYSAERFAILEGVFGSDIQLEKYGSGKEYYLLKREGHLPVALLCKQITYLGNPHPIWKKRIQIPDWYKTFYIEKHNVLDVRFIGIYRYDTNVIFVDFDVDLYVHKKAHNSSAHVYTNDLYQAVVNGYFEKVDKNKNLIRVISKQHFRDYLQYDSVAVNTAFAFFNAFNQEFPFNREMSVLEGIEKMRVEGSRKWAEGEWAGFYLEHLFQQYLSGTVFACVDFCENHGRDELDFDLKFVIDGLSFYGDLKTSNISKNEVPGNDSCSMDEAIRKYGKLWYVIYELEAQKDEEPYPTVRARNEYLVEHGKWPKNKEFDPLSYFKKLKTAVTFKRMFVLEINAINRGLLLKDFNQGHQPDGSPRAPKYNITKRDIDNFVVYSYEPEV